MLKRTLAFIALGSIIGMCASVSQAVTLDTSALDQTLMREASEGPRGADNERPGDRHRRRGGRNGLNVQSSFDIAREATEAPRGADNDRHRRRGGRSV